MTERRNWITQCVNCSIDISKQQPILEASMELKWENKGCLEGEEKFDSENEALLYFEKGLKNDETVINVHLCDGTTGCSVRKLK